jgi:hypothetical protein
MAKTPVAAGNFARVSGNNDRRVNWSRWFFWNWLQLILQISGIVLFFLSAVKEWITLVFMNQPIFLLPKSSPQSFISHTLFPKTAAVSFWPILYFW